MAFESSPAMYFIADEAGRIISANGYAAEQLGYTVTDLVGRPVLNVFYEPDRQSVQGHANACFEQPGRVMTCEARQIRKDGTMLWVRETANAVILKGHPVLLVTCDDITEKKRAEALLTGEKRILEMVAKGDSLAQILDSLCRLVEEQASGSWRRSYWLTAIACGMVALRAFQRPTQMPSLEWRSGPVQGPAGLLHTSESR